MVDNRDLVFQTLSALGFSVDYQYPAKFETFPCISYFDSGHVAEDYKDGKPDIDMTEITVDVWQKADKHGSITEIHTQTDSAMRAAGFFRQAFINQFEDDTKIQHITFKYVKPEKEV
jgi:hypothetical protein